MAAQVTLHSVNWKALSLIQNKGKLTFAIAIIVIIYMIICYL